MNAKDPELIDRFIELRARLALLVARVGTEASRLTGPLRLAEPISEAEAEEDQLTDPVMTWDV